MPRAPWTKPALYNAAELFVDRCLREEGSLFNPGRVIWTAEGAKALRDRVGAEDLRSLSFMEKLLEQIDGVSPEATQLTAELLYVVLLPEGDTGAAKKLEHINAVLEQIPGTSVPDDLAEALGSGIASYGQVKNRRDAFLRLFIEFLLSWTELPLERRQELLDDPWQFREIVEATPRHSGGPQAEALLYLVFPEEFEPIIAPEAKRKIAKRFEAVLPASAKAENVDRRIAEIRKEIKPIVGASFMYYDEPVRRVWSSAAKPWDEFLTWATRLYELSRFDADERDYKLEIAERVRALRTAVEAGSSDWLELLPTVFAKPNNLTSWRANDTFTKWSRENPDAASSLLQLLWSNSDLDSDGLAAVFRDWPEANRPGNQLALASLFLMGTDATRYPVFRATPYRRATQLVGADEATHEVDVELDDAATYRPEDLATLLNVTGVKLRTYLRERYPRDEAEHGTDWQLSPDQARDAVDHFQSSVPEPAEQVAARYLGFLKFLDEFRLRLLARGIRLRDRLDAQGLMWWIASADPPDEWTEEEKLAFREYSAGDKEVNRKPVAPGSSGLAVTAGKGEAKIPPAPAALAERLFVTEVWLDEIIDLLNDKRQVVFYGPPGTGKTYIAQALGEHVENAGGESRLVQFHPSYSYEDFFEGFRPTPAGEGALSFQLTPGPLRLIADEARQNPAKPYLLIVDEINRGNIAKIFGELYFLLEYRDQPASLQYSPQKDFTLPPNLFFIGTMNTADRSIALVDSALRRRFYFVPFLPTEPPLKNVLTRWLKSEGLDPEPAILLQRLNEAIGATEFSIGPAYFMAARGTDGVDLNRVWRYAIKPLLEEHYYGTGRNIDEFSFDSLRKRGSEVLVEEPPDDDEAP